MHCVIRAINFIKYPDSFFLFFFSFLVIIIDGKLVSVFEPSKME